MSPRRAANRRARPRLRTACLGWALGLASLSACDDGDRSDAGRYLVATSLRSNQPQRSTAVLVDSPFSAQFGGFVSNPDLWIPSGCAPLEATGVLSEVEDERFVALEPGEGTLEILTVLTTCTNAPEFQGAAPDRWTVHAHTLDEASAVWAFGDDDLAGSLSPGPALTFPEALGQLRGVDEGPILVVAGSPFSFSPTLALSGADGLVELRHDSDSLQLELEPHDESLRLRNPDGTPRLRIEGALVEGDSVESSVLVFDQALPLPAIEAVPLASVERLELVPAYFRSPDDRRPWGAPAGLLAMGFDAEGRRVYGLPTSWTVTRGHQRAIASPSADILQLGASCVEPTDEARARTVEVEVRVGALLETATFEWTALPGDIDPETTELPLCDPPPGCACTSTGASSDSPHDAGAGLALIGLAALYRRRRRLQPRRASAASSCPR